MTCSVSSHVPINHRNRSQQKFFGDVYLGKQSSWRSSDLPFGLGNLSAVLFFPIFMYTFQLGITGAAISTVASQYIVAILMLWKLNEKTVLLQPNIRNLHFGGYLKSGGFLLGRTLAAVLTVTLSTSMAARLGAIPMAAHQICLQVWLSASLLADAQAASGQALIASSFARKDYGRVKLITHVALKTGLATGILLAIILGLSFPSFARCFTNDSQVLDIVRSGLLFVSASQPLNALAYIFDGLHYGVSDFPYAAISMMIVGALASIFLIYAPPIIGLPGVWSGLTIFMGLRSVAGFMRLSAKNGPWWFLQDSQENEDGVCVCLSREREAGGLIKFLFQPAVPLCSNKMKTSARKHIATTTLPSPSYATLETFVFLPFINLF
uniref:Polysaccharide biosynthesis protein C-terminal domain-containing protein n=1 Tax=Solanum lycopersicum TaxID=4081 RepID=A0A3Q7FJ35_SOLLC